MKGEIRLLNIPYDEIVGVMKERGFKVIKKSVFTDVLDEINWGIDREYGDGYFDNEIDKLYEIVEKAVDEVAYIELGDEE